MKTGRKVGYRKQFCPKGHDTFVVGREGGGCRACRRNKTAIWYKNNRQKKNDSSREIQWKKRGIF